MRQLYVAAVLAFLLPSPAGAQPPLLPAREIDSSGNLQFRGGPVLGHDGAQLWRPTPHAPEFDGEAANRAYLDPNSARAKLFADSVPRTALERAGDVLSARECPTYATDAGACLNYALSKVQPGQTILYPPRPDGTAIPWTTEANINKAVRLDLGTTPFKLVGAITALNVTGMYAMIEGGFLDGDRTTGQTAIVTAAFQPIFRGLRIERTDVGFKQEGGYRPQFDAIRMRNIKTTVAWLYDGVGPDIRNSGYDSDGVWYCAGANGSGSYVPPAYSSGDAYTTQQCVTYNSRVYRSNAGSTGVAPSGTDADTPQWQVMYGQPTNSGILLQTEGALFINNDFIHSGQVACLNIANRGRNIEWGLFSNSYCDSTLGADSVRVFSDQASYKTRGLFFSNFWSATGNIGLHVTGTQNIDGVYWNGGPIHNNTAEGVRIDNPLVHNIKLNGVQLVGNNSAGRNANNFYTSTAGDVSCTHCQFGRQANWASQTYFAVFTGAAQAGSVTLTGSHFDPGGYTQGPFSKVGSGAISFPNVSGIVTSAKGVASFAAAATTASVNPGLSVPYSIKDVTVTPGGNFGPWITGATGTPATGSFTINTGSAPGASVPFGWSVTVDQL
jgi:hypothetical protein